MMQVWEFGSLLVGRACSAVKLFTGISEIFPPGKHLEKAGHIVKRTFVNPYYHLLFVSIHFFFFTVSGHDKRPTFLLHKKLK